MQKNTRIIITRAGNGFEVEPMPGPGTGDTDVVKVFATKKNLLRYIDRHFSEKRNKKVDDSGGASSWPGEAGET